MMGVLRTHPSAKVAVQVTCDEPEQAKPAGDYDISSVRLRLDNPARGLSALLGAGPQGSGRTGTADQILMVWRRSILHDVADFKNDNSADSALLSPAMGSAGGISNGLPASASTAGWM